MGMGRTLARVILLFAVSSADAYNLFDPVPSDRLRDLSTDRPDTTESPYTVDAGHFQIEWEAISYGEDRARDVHTKILSSSPNLKVGLTDNIDFQLVLEPHVHVQDKAAGSSHTADGIGDTELRLKINLWGNDSGDTAFALMPFVRLATHDKTFGENGKTEGGLIMPLAFKLPAGWSSAVMLEVDAVRNEENDGYISEFLQSITFAHDIYGSLGGFFEFVNDSRNESDSAAEAYFNAGLTYAVGSNLQFDGGFNLGLTHAAQDSRFFLGVSYRY